MIERYRLHRQATVFVDNSLLGRVDRMEYHFISQADTEQFYLSVEHIFQLPRRINVQIVGTSQHAKCRNHARQPETMVAMKMRNKDRPNLSKAYVR